MTVQNQADTEAVEQARQQIRSVVGEISQLARSDIAPAEFFDAFLKRVISSLGAVGGAVWTSEDGQRLGLCRQLNFPESELAETANQTAHGRIVGHVFTSGEGALVPANSPTPQIPEAANPTPYMLLLGPLRSDNRSQGVVEIFQRPTTDVAIQRGYLRFLLEMCQLAAGYLRARDMQRFGQREALWGRLEQFTHAVHQSLDLTQTAYTLANDGCRLIECDRVSVIVRRGRKSKLRAISGQDTVEPRANVVVLLTRLVDKVIATGEPLWYTGDNANLPPQLEEALEAYVDEAHTRTIGILPLVVTKPVEAEDLAPPKTEIIGALVVEQIDQSGVSDTVRERSDMICRHGTAALANAVQHDRMFLRPVWDTLAKSKWLVEARQLPKTVIASAVALVVLLVLVLWPARFEISAKGTLQPTERHDVFAQEAGIVDAVEVDQGNEVKVGQTLAELSNRDLDVSITDTSGRLDATSEQINSIRQARGDSKLSYDERNRLNGQLAQLESTQASLRKQLDLLLMKRTLLKVKSPLDGQVITWDVKHRLLKRPVEKGAVLMSIADTKQDWDVEMLVPEDHIGHILRMEKEIEERNKKLPPGKEKEKLIVTYIMATDPSTRRDAEVVEIQRSAEVRGDEGNTVLVRAKLSGRKSLTPAELRPGAAVTGKVYCGYRSLGYVWFHDLVAFVRSKILFRF